MYRVLLVEDDRLLGRAICEFLRKNGFFVEWIDAPLVHRMEGHDIAVVDWILKDGSGLDFVKKIKRGNPPMPLIMITVKSDLKDKLMAFESGVDDYLTKPFHPEELLARIKALLNRYYFTGKLELSDGVVVDLDRGIVEIDEKTVELTQKELALIEALVRRKGRIVSYDFLMEYVWSEEASYETLKSHVYNLRRKLGKNIIKNVKNLGYRID